MRGLRVDTFKIFNNRPDLRPGREASFNHNPGRAARPGMDDGDETLYLQWLIIATLPAAPLPLVVASRYPRCRSGASVARRAPPNLKQVNPYGGQ